MQEVWKVWKKTRIALWEVSNQGNVKKNGVLYECRLDRGYKVFNGWKLHRAVAKLFVPNPENKPCIDHINTNPLDNRACNLRWVTPKENNNNPLTRKHNSEAHKDKPRSEESKRKQSESLKNYYTSHPEVCEERSIKQKEFLSRPEIKKFYSELNSGSNNPMYGKNYRDYMTNEAKEIQSEKRIKQITNRRFLNNGINCVLVKPDIVDYYISQGYTFGKLQKKKKKTKIINKTHKN